MRTRIETGVPYRTRLEPPPADAAVAHAARVEAAAKLGYLEGLSVE